MNSSDILKKYIRTKESGLLSIKIEGENHLLKVYFESGEVVSLSLGACKNEECLKKLKDLAPLEHSFLRGVKSPAISTVPLTKKLIELTGIGDMELSEKMTPSTSSVNIPAQMVASVEEEFINLIGPIGRMIVDNIFSEMSYTRGNPMGSEDYSYLSESLTKELPAQQQALFSALFKNKGK